MTHWLRIVILLVAGFYLAGFLLLYAFQLKLIFIPEILPRDYTFDLGPSDKELYLETSDGEIINALFFKGGGGNVILYLHGNAGSLSSWQYVPEMFVQQGFSVLIIDYRGYGKSTGAISEAGLNIDAQTAYDYLKNTYPPNKILIYGRSIGTGVAVGLAAKNHTRGLILEAPYTSLADLAQEKLPIFFPRLLLKTKFENLNTLKSVSCPVLFIHGTRDELIPPVHTKRLFEVAAGKKRKLFIDGGTHNDLMEFPQYRDAIRNVLPSFFEL